VQFIVFIFAVYRVAGSLLLKSNTYAIYLDQQCVVSQVTSFLEIWAALFATYFVFNVEYLPSTVCTMEFFQR